MYRNSLYLNLEFQKWWGKHAASLAVAKAALISLAMKMDYGEQPFSHGFLHTLKSAILAEWSGWNGKEVRMAT